MRTRLYQQGCNRQTENLSRHKVLNSMITSQNIAGAYDCVGDVSGHICPRGGLTLYSLFSSFAVVTLPLGDPSLLTLLSRTTDSGVGRESRPSTE